MASSPKPRTYVRPPAAFTQLNREKQYPSFHPAYCPEVFIVWKTGSRAPRSFHVTREAAVEAMKAFVKAGEEVSVLHAVPVASVSAAISVTIHDRAHPAMPQPGSKEA